MMKKSKLNKINARVDEVFNCKTSTLNKTEACMRKAHAIIDQVNLSEELLKELKMLLLCLQFPFPLVIFNRDKTVFFQNKKSKKINFASLGTKLLKEDQKTSKKYFVKKIKDSKKILIMKLKQ